MLIPRIESLAKTEYQMKVLWILRLHIPQYSSYSCGLQACISATAKILVESWVLAAEENTGFVADIENMTELFDDSEL